jgi:hypothetical protein
MLKLNKELCRRFVASSLSLGITMSGAIALAGAADSDLNIRTYSPQVAGQTSAQATETSLDSAAVTDKAGLQSESDVVNDAPGPTATGPSTEPQSGGNDSGSAPALRQELPQTDAKSAQSEPPSGDTANPSSSLRTLGKGDSALDTKAQQPADSSGSNTFGTTDGTARQEASNSSELTGSAPSTDTSKEGATTGGDKNISADGNANGGSKVLQGYARVVPSGTKFPIVMDTAVDSDTSQEGDEFSARTTEDVTIDGETAVPAGSIIKGRIATLNAPRHLNRSGSVAFKFDTITTPDNRQIPLVANLVARGGVVHAKRGLKDVAIDAATFTIPSAAGLGIGLIAGSRASGLGVGGGGLIGAGVGVALGAAILCAKKGKKIDVRPGDELKIELAEDLRMPTL